MSTDARAAGVLAHWERDGLSHRNGLRTQQRLWTGQPAGLLRWLSQHEPSGGRCDATRSCSARTTCAPSSCGDISTDTTDAGLGGLLDVTRTRYPDESTASWAWPNGATSCRASARAPMSSAKSRPGRRLDRPARRDAGRARHGRRVRGGGRLRCRASRSAERDRRHLQHQLDAAHHAAPGHAARSPADRLPGRRLLPRHRRLAQFGQQLRVVLQEHPRRTRWPRSRAGPVDLRRLRRARRPGAAATERHPVPALPVRWPGRRARRLPRPAAPSTTGRT